MGRSWRRSPSPICMRWTTRSRPASTRPGSFSKKHRTGSPEPWDRRNSRAALLLAEEQWRKSFQVSPPGLPFMVGARGFPIDVLNPRLRQQRVQATDTRGESLRFRRTHAEVQDVHLLRERRRIGEHRVEVGLQVRLAIFEHAANATESADV